MQLDQVMLELREKELENKTKKISLQKMEVQPSTSTLKSGSVVVLKALKRPKSKVILDRTIESDAYTPLQQRKEEIAFEKMSVLSVSSGEPERFQNEDNKYRF